MNVNFEITKTLIDRLKTITFFQRLFNWKSIQMLLLDAVQEIQKYTSRMEQISFENSELNRKQSELLKDHQVASSELQKKETAFANLEKTLHEKEESIKESLSIISGQKSTIEGLRERIQELELIEGNLRVKLDETIKIKDDLSKENNTFKNNEESRSNTLMKELSTLNSIREKMEKDRQRELDAAVTEKVEHLKTMKETWAKHQINVKNQIKGIAQKLVIEYVDKVPFKGEPDNTLRICGEYIAFDAKSPAGEDLSNFPTYIKDQAEKAKKYSKQDDVKRDVFFVVPTNTLECLNQHVYHFADHDVYVIAIDSLEQIILSLKKIESYEFAEKLNPEERDNICRVIGKFVHITKRRVQIDAFFMKHFLEMAYQAEADLPKDILEKSLEFEKSEKLNPPQEKRAKAINVKELDKETQKLNSEISLKGISVNSAEISGKIGEVDLYNEGE